LRGDLADACVIGEGTQLSIALATRGGFVVDLICKAGNPEGYFSEDELVSPAIPVGRLLGWVESWALRRHTVEPGRAYAGFGDPAPVQVLAIEANRIDPDVPLSVPLVATLRVYFQFLPGEDVPKLIAQIRESLNQFCSADPFFCLYRSLWSPAFDAPLEGHELSPEHPWSQCIAEAAAAVLQHEPLMTAAPYPCDAFIMHRQFGIPTLIFGPSGAGAHNADEYGRNCVCLAVG
jgi:acetylornithine deacetylase